MAQRMFCVKQKQFFWRGIHNLPERWAKCIEADGQYFEAMKNEFPLKIICFFTTKNWQRVMHTLMHRGSKFSWLILAK